MKEFSYTIRDSVGIHARPAGLLVKLAQSFDSNITVIKGEKSVGAKKLISLMGLGVVCGDKVTIQAEGADEEAAIDAIQAFFQENL